MKIKNPQNAVKVPFDLDAYILHSEKNIELVFLTLKPGERLAKHTNPFDVIFFVVEGAGVLSIEEESHKLFPTDTIKVTSEKLRGWENKGSENLKILVIKLF